MSRRGRGYGAHPLVYVGLSATVFALAGCTTTLSGRPATASSEGLRYYLPAPHIYMTPQPDGSVRAEVKYLPDPNNAYTLRLNSYLSKATFDIQTVNGMLTSVNLDADSSAIAVAGVQAATSIRTAQLTAEKTEAQALKTKEDAKQAAIKEATEAVRAQREKVALLQDKQNFYTANPTAADDPTRLALKLEISQEGLKLQQLERRLGLARSTPASSFNDPGDTASGAVTNAFGPMFFRVLPIGDGVKLVALEPQRVIGASVGAVVGAATPDAVAVVPTPKNFEIKSADAQRQIVVTFNVPISVDAATSRLMRPSESAITPVVVGSLLKFAGTDAVTEVKVDLPANLAAGRYRLDLAVQPTGGSRRMVPLTVSWLEK